MDSDTFKEDPIPDELMQAYRASIPGKLSLVKDLIDVVVNKADVESLKNLRLVVHKLAGSAGMYGYKKVSQLCKQLDADLVTKINGFSLGSLTPSWLAALSVFFQQLEKEFTCEKQ